MDPKNEDQIRREAYLERDVRQLLADVADIDGKYVTVEIYISDKDHLDKRITPLERLVYGLVGLVLVTVVAAILQLALAK